MTRNQAVQKIKTCAKIFAESGNFDEYRAFVHALETPITGRSKQRYIAMHLLPRKQVWVIFRGAFRGRI